MTDPSGYAKTLALPAGFDAPPPAAIRRRHCSRDHPRRPRRRRGAASNASLDLFRETRGRHVADRSGHRGGGTTSTPVRHECEFLGRQVIHVSASRPRRRLYRAAHTSSRVARSGWQHQPFQPLNPPASSRLRRDPRCSSQRSRDNVSKTGTVRKKIRFSPVSRGVVVAPLITATGARILMAVPRPCARQRFEGQEGAEAGDVVGHDPACVALAGDQPLIAQAVAREGRWWHATRIQRRQPSLVRSAQAGLPRCARDQPGGAASRLGFGQPSTGSLRHLDGFLDLGWHALGGAGPIPVRPHAPPRACHPQPTGRPAPGPAATPPPAPRRLPRAPCSRPARASAFS